MDYLTWEMFQIICEQLIFDIRDSKRMTGHFVQTPICIRWIESLGPRVLVTLQTAFLIPLQRGTAEAFSLCFAFLGRKIAWINCKLCKWDLGASFRCSPVGYVKWNGKDSGPHLTLLYGENGKPLLSNYYKHILII